MRRVCTWESDKTRVEEGNARRTIVGLRLGQNHLKTSVSSIFEFLESVWTGRRRIAQAMFRVEIRADLRVVVGRGKGVGLGSWEVRVCCQSQPLYGALEVEKLEE